ncbi:MAG: gliding motility-associated-like protein [Saprospiraceae bacterium]|jgi:gliding motility-associated-like protein
MRTFMLRQKNRRKLNLSFCFLIVFAIQSFGQGSDPVWIRDYVWGGDSLDVLMDVIEIEGKNAGDLTMLSGGHMISPVSGEVTNGASGSYDFWVVHADSSGAIIWSGTYGGDSTELFSQIVEVQDGYVLVGSSVSVPSGNKTSGTRGGYDYWVVKIDKDGNKLWDRNYGGSENDYLLSAHALNNGNVLLGGNSLSNAGGEKSADSYGGSDYWVLVIDSDGDVVWDLTLGGDKDDVLTSLFEDDGVVIGGYSNSDISGTKSNNSYGGYDYWIIRLNKLTGTLEWDFTYGGPADDFLDVILPDDHSGDIFASGTTASGVGGGKTSTTYGMSDYWVINIDSAGGVGWDLTIGGTGTDVLTDAITSPEGALIVGGYSNSSIGGNKTSDNNGGYDYWIVKIDTAGEVYWQKNYGGSQDDTLQSLEMRCDRGLYLGGHSASGISGDRTFSNRGYEDYWVIKLDIATIPKFKDNDHCYGTVMHFFDDSHIWPDTWTWDFGDPASGANSANERNPLHQFSAPGEYSVTMTVKEGCQKDTSVIQTLNVWENKIAGKAQLGAAQILCVGKQLELQNDPRIDLPTDATYLWGGGETTSKITIDSVGFYNLSLTSGNCTSTDTLEIAPCPIIYVPNAFSPNQGIDGMNSEWGFVGIGIIEFELYIYDRWGLLIFYAEDIEEWWNGTYKGRNVQQDVYVYKAFYQGVASNQQNTVGTVTLVR